MKRVICHVRAWLVVGLLAIGAAPGAADEWTAHTLGNVEFAVPADWEVVQHRRGSKYFIESPDHQFTLFVQWWAPDAPSEGPSGIVRQEARRIAGQRAEFTHFDFDATGRLLEIAFPERNAKGERFLFQLWSTPMGGPVVPLAEHKRMLDALLSRLVYDGVPATTGGGGMATGTGGEVYHDAQGGFSLSLPPGWSATAVDTSWLRQVVFAPADRRRLVLVASVRGDTPDAAKARQTAFVDVIFRDVFDPGFIEDEVHTRIDGRAVHAVAYSAKVDTVNGIRLPYDRARTWIYLIGEGAHRLVAVTIDEQPRTEDTGPRLTAQMVRTIRFGADAEAPARAVPTMSWRADGDPVTAGLDSKRAVRNGPPRATAFRLSRPMRLDRITTFHWNNGRGAAPGTIALRDDKGRVHGPWPARGRAGQGGVTDAYWDATPHRVLPAGKYTILDSDRRTWATNADVDNRGIFEVALQPVRKVARPDASDTAEKSRAGKDAGTERATSPTRAPSRSAQAEPPAAELPAPGAGDHPASVPTLDPAQSGAESAPPQEPGARPDAAPPAARVIFDGQSLKGVVPFAFNGVDFETAATLSDGALQLGFPRGLGWAKLGIATPDAAVEVPRAGAETALRITATIDADASTGVTLALAPHGAASENPSEVSGLRVKLENLGGTRGKVTVRTKAPNETLRGRFRWPAGETRFHVVLRPDKVLEVRRDDGAQLARLPLPKDMRGQALALQAYLQVNGKNDAGRLTLRRVAVERVALDPPPDLGTRVTAPRSVALFDGKALAPVWAPATQKPERFHRFARIAHDGLRIEWDAEDDQSWHGIAMPEAAIWLDRLHGTGETRIEIDLDGAATEGVGIGLQGHRVRLGNRMSNGAYKLELTRAADGSYTALSALRAAEDEGLRSTGLAAIPDRITLVLTAAGVRVEGKGMPPGTLDFPQARPGAGLRMQVRALPTPEDTAALTLRGVRLDHHSGPLPPARRPAPGITPLPRTVLFDGRAGRGWIRQPTDGTHEGASFAAGRDGLTLTRQEDGDRIALVSAAPVAVLDDRLARTAHEVALDLDPAPGLAARIWLHADPERYAKSALAALTLRRPAEGPRAGALEIRFHTGNFHYGTWRRVIAARDLPRDWDGTVRLRLREGRITALLGETPVIHALNRKIERGRRYHLTLTPGGPERDAGQVTLRRVTAGWVTPDGMTALDRAFLVDTQDFDPDRFLDLLAGPARDAKAQP
ncbi:hypothetical protein [Roseovarius salinarum]|uniref:hypothetical protein n=1 Tax=Roseovarius salinarum TaxID=1981892 RepID=UPI000C33B452|nr:hypothetical protein [Roseovarius salinarum]